MGGTNIVLLLNSSTWRAVLTLMLWQPELLGSKGCFQFCVVGEIKLGYLLHFSPFCVGNELNLCLY